MASVFVVLLGKPIQKLGPLRSSHSAVDVLHINAYMSGISRKRQSWLRALEISVNNVLELVGEQFGSRDISGKRDGMMQYALSIILAAVCALQIHDAASVSAVKQRFPHTQESSSIGHVDLIGVAHRIEQDRLRQHRLVDLHNHELVVSEQPLIDSRSKGEAMTDAAINLGVIHGSNEAVRNFLCARQRLVTRLIDTRSSRHIEALDCSYPLVIVNAHKGGLVFPAALAMHAASGAMSLVTDDQVKDRKSEFLGSMDDIDGLIGGENDIERVGVRSKLPF